MRHAPHSISQKPTYRRPFRVVAASAVLLLALAGPADAGFRLNITRGGGSGGGGHSSARDAAARSAYAQVQDARRELGRAHADARRLSADDPAVLDARRALEETRRRYLAERGRVVAALVADPDYAALRREIYYAEESMAALRADGRSTGVAARQPAAHALLVLRTKASIARRDALERDDAVLDAWYAMIDADALVADLQADARERAPITPAVAAAQARLTAARTALARAGD